MLSQTLIAALLLAICVVIHAVGTLAILAPLRTWFATHAGANIARPLLFLIVIFLFVFALHAVEMFVWALAYWITGALPTLGDSIYFSVVSYTTVGYGDVVLDAEWRTLGASEAAVGILLFGWSTALLFAVIQRMYTHQH